MLPVPLSLSLLTPIPAFPLKGGRGQAFLPLSGGGLRWGWNVAICYHSYAMTFAPGPSIPFPFHPHPHLPPYRGKELCFPPPFRGRIEVGVECQDAMPSR